MPPSDKELQESAESILKMLPKAPLGSIRGYLKKDVGLQVSRFLEQFKPWLDNLKRVTPEQEGIHDLEGYYLDLLRLLPSNASNDIMGYLTVDAGKAFLDLKEWLDWYIVQGDSPRPLSHSSVVEYGGFFVSKGKVDLNKLAVANDIHALVSSDSGTPDQLRELGEKIDEYYPKHPGLFGYQDARGFSVISMLIQVGDEHFLAALFGKIDPSGHINAVNEDLTTPLYHAVARGDLGVINLLLDRGATAELLERHTPLSEALYDTPTEKVKDVIKCLQSSGTDLMAEATEQLTDRLGQLGI